jgi:hypothetical protein
MSEETITTQNQDNRPGSPENKKEMSELMKSHLDSITGAADASHDSWRSTN